MKAIIAAVCCATVALLGMQVYMRMKGAALAVSGQQADVQPQPAEVSPPRSKPSPPPANKSRLPTAKSAEPKPIQARAPNTMPVPTPAADMYYTVVRDKRSVPSRIIVHNTPVGACTILLIGAGSSDGYFMSKGTTSGPTKHKWEVQVYRGSVTVFWDGQRVPPG